MSTSGDGPAGRVLDGRYRIGARIARGGMSTVYRGTDLRLDRPVAIKIMQPSFAADPSFLTRFEREARLAAGVAHRGVVGVYDQGRDGDVVFLVMELVDGGTLRDLIRQSGGLSVSVTMSILEPLLAALGAAHASGLVHRDVKPENVLISSKGEVKVADFGLVRAVTSSTVATGDVILGTVAYLSPEQVSTGAADPRSDVYSAGIVAYEMLTGAPPYVGDNAISVAYQHVHSDVPPVTDRAPGVPIELDDLILAATRRDPMARPRDASAFLSALVSIRGRLALARAAVPVPRATAGATPTVARPTVRPAGPTGTSVVPGPQPTSAQPAMKSTAATRRKATLRRWIIVFTVVLLLGGAAAAGGWWLGSGRWTSSPAVVGVSRQSAESLVRSAGLVPQFTSVPSNTVGQGTVARSVPSPGARVLRGSDVDLVVSSGKPVVPAITPGTTTPAAFEAISAAHLTPISDPAADQYDKTVSVGAVVTTRPAADTALPIAARVLVVRSKGPPPAIVPAVAGKSAEDARNKLLVAGFTLGPDKPGFDIDAADGTVLGTDPAGGKLLGSGSKVALVIATSIVVPSVRGESLGQATSDLRRSGFTVTVGDPAFDGDIDPGAAVGTTPAEGSQGRPGASGAGPDAVRRRRGAGCHPGRRPSRPLPARRAGTQHRGDRAVRGERRIRDHAEPVRRPSGRARRDGARHRFPLADQTGQGELGRRQIPDDDRQTSRHVQSGPGAIGRCLHLVLQLQTDAQREPDRP